MGGLLKPVFEAMAREKRIFGSTRVARRFSPHRHSSVRQVRGKRPRDAWDKGTLATAYDLWDGLFIEPRIVRRYRPHEVATYWRDGKDPTISKRAALRLLRGMIAAECRRAGRPEPSDVREEIQILTAMLAGGHRPNPQALHEPLEGFHDPLDGSWVDARQITRVNPSFGRTKRSLVDDDTDTATWRSLGADAERDDFFAKGGYFLEKHSEGKRETEKEKLRALLGNPVPVIQLCEFLISRPAKNKNERRARKRLEKWLMQYISLVAYAHGRPVETIWRYLIVRYKRTSEKTIRKWIREIAAEIEAGRRRIRSLESGGEPPALESRRERTPVCFKCAEPKPLHEKTKVCADCFVPTSERRPIGSEKYALEVCDRTLVKRCLACDFAYTGSTDDARQTFLEHRRFCERRAENRMVGPNRHKLPLPPNTGAPTPPRQQTADGLRRAQAAREAVGAGVSRGYFGGRRDRVPDASGGVRTSPPSLS